MAAVAVRALTRHQGACAPSPLPGVLLCWPTIVNFIVIIPSASAAASNNNAPTSLSGRRRRRPHRRCYRCCAGGSMAEALRPGSVRNAHCTQCCCTTTSTLGAQTKASRICRMRCMYVLYFRRLYYLSVCAKSKHSRRYRSDQQREQHLILYKSVAAIMQISAGCNRSHRQAKTTRAFRRHSSHRLHKNRCALFVSTDSSTCSPNHVSTASAVRHNNQLEPSAPRASGRAEKSGYRVCVCVCAY